MKNILVLIIKSWSHSIFVYWYRSDKSPAIVLAIKMWNIHTFFVQGTPHVATLMEYLSETTAFVWIWRKAAQMLTDGETSVTHQPLYFLWHVETSCCKAAGIHLQQPHLSLSGRLFQYALNKGKTIVYTKLIQSRLSFSLLYIFLCCDSQSSDFIHCHAWHFIGL